MENDLSLIYKVQAEISILKGIQALLDWDENTNMPESALYGRSEQIKLIDNLIEKYLISDELSQAISNLKNSKVSKKDLIILNQLEKEVRKAKLIPPNIRKTLVKHTVLSQEAWKNARKSNDFSIFEPYLKKMIELKKVQAKLIEPDSSIYDSLIKEYEEDMDTIRYDKIFNYLKPELIKLLNKIKSTSRFRNQKPLNLKIKKHEQKAIINDFLNLMGLSPKKFHISTSPHPFTTRISRNDVRFTTRYLDPLESFFTTLHEAGHALYEMNLPKKYYHTVIYNQASYGLDEALALLWENNIGKSKDFWKQYYIIFRKYVDNLINWKDFYCHINYVNSSFIRVNADEVTYILHIILRYEIEKELFNGSLKTSQIKDAWNKKMEEMLGIVPKNDNDGLLQDIHWATGDFGYFPTYALGSIYAVQLTNSMLKDIPESGSLIRNQKFLMFVEWLRHHVYSKGMTRKAEQIVKNATGKGLDPKLLVDYLNEKYSDIYKF